jgi:hypothetical protein
VDIQNIDGLIYTIRGKRVMIDSDLAVLYGIETGNLNKAVNRNRSRFPEDFMFRLTPAEAENLRFQIGISRWGGRRYLPSAFTEHGVVMLSSVLGTERAVRVNIRVVRAFVLLRTALATSKDLTRRMEGVEKKLAEHDAALGDHVDAIRAVFDEVRRLMGPPDGPKRRIGFSDGT